LGVVAIDRSGNLTDAAFWVVAVRKEDKQNHRALEISQSDFQNYIKKCKSLNYREKISAAIIYESLRPIIQSGDSVEIDKDYLGYHAEDVKKCLKRLLNKFKNSDPAIGFFSKPNDDWKEHVKLADRKSKQARKKKLKNPRVKKCPDLSTLLDALKIY
jgi:hypothetical protein